MGYDEQDLSSGEKTKMIISYTDIPDVEGKEPVRNLNSDPMTVHFPIIYFNGQDSDAIRILLKHYGVPTLLNTYAISK